VRWCFGGGGSGAAGNLQSAAGADSQVGAATFAVSQGAGDALVGDGSVCGGWKWVVDAGAGGEKESEEEGRSGGEVGPAKNHHCLPGSQQAQAQRCSKQQQHAQPRRLAASGLPLPWNCLALASRTPAYD